MSKVIHLLLLLGVAIQLTTAALLVRGLPSHHANSSHRRKPKSRRAFLRWDRDEQFARYQDRERFREEMTRSVHQLMQNHNVKMQLSNVEDAATKDLKKRFDDEKRRLDRMRDFTIASLNDVIART